MKKRLAIGLSLLTSMNLVYAGNVYFGPSLFIQRLAGPNASYLGMHPRFALGYEDLTDNIYIAGEVFGNPGNLDLSNKTDRGYPGVKVSNSVGASLIPGVLLNDRLIGFARAGIVYSNFSTPNRSRTGWQGGVGLQTSLTPRWDMRAEYIYTVYNHQTSLGSVKSNEIGIGAIYKFEN